MEGIRCRMLQVQKRRLIELVNEHRHVLNGQQSANGSIIKKQIWTKIADKLNALGGIKKTPEKWARSFTDIKSTVKIKIRKSRKARHSTGVGELELNDEEEMVKEILCSEGELSFERYARNQGDVETFIVPELDVPAAEAMEVVCTDAEPNVQSQFPGTSAVLQQIHRPTSSPIMDNSGPSTPATSKPDVSVSASLTPAPSAATRSTPASRQNVQKILTAKKSNRMSPAERSRRYRQRLRALRESQMGSRKASRKDSFAELSLEISDRTCKALEKLAERVKESNELSRRTLSAIENLTHEMMQKNFRLLEQLFSV